MNKKQLNTNHFDRYLGELIEVARAASQNYQICLIYKEDKPKYLKAMLEYSGFFVTSISAHFIAMVVSVSKLYENRDNSVNIYNLIKLIDNNKKLVNNNSLEEIKKSLEEKETLIKKIAVLRSNHTVHISIKLDYDEVLKKTRIKLNDFKELIDLSYGLFDKIKPHIHFGNRAKDATYRLLDALLKNVF